MNVGFEVGGAFVNFSAGRMMGWKNRTYQRWSGTEQKTRRFKKVGRLEIFKQWNVWHQAEEVKNKKKEKVCQTLLAGCLRSWLEKFTLCHRSGWTKDWPKRRHQKQTSMWGLVGWRPRPLVVRLEWRVRIRTRGFRVVAVKVAALGAQVLAVVFAYFITSGIMALDANMLTC